MCSWQDASNPLNPCQLESCLWNGINACLLPEAHDMGIEETAEISMRMRASGMSGQCSLDGKTLTTSSPSAFLQCCRGRLATQVKCVNTSYIMNIICSVSQGTHEPQPTWLYSTRSSKDQGRKLAVGLGSMSRYRASMASRKRPWTLASPKKNQPRHHRLATAVITSV